MAETLKKVKRSAIAHYLDTTPTSDTRTYELMNLGISGLTVDYAPETSSSQYIADNNATTEVNSYAPTTSIEQEVIKGDKIYDFINRLRRSRAILSDAYTTMITVEAYDKSEDNNYPAEKQTVSVQIDEFGGDQPDPPHISYTINFIGAPVKGYFNVKTKEFSEDGSSGGEGGGSEESGGVSVSIAEALEKAGVTLEEIIDNYRNPEGYSGNYIKSINFINAEKISNSVSCAALTDVAMPVATEVADGVFKDCYSLKNVTMPLVKFILPLSYSGTGAFQNCYSLKYVNMASAVQIGYNAFENCYALKKADIPEVKILFQSSFNNCVSLESVNMPLAVDISNNAFENCYSLKNVYMPNVERVYSSAFKNCYSLKSVNIPLSTQVYRDAFENCYSLEKVYINKANAIESGTFTGCYSLISFCINSDIVVELENTDVFSDTPIAEGHGYIYVPDALVDSYKSDSNWSVYANQIKPMSEYVDA